MLFCDLSNNLCVFEGFENDSSSTKDENNVGSHGASGSSVGIKVVIVCLGGCFCFLLAFIQDMAEKEERRATCSSSKAV